jgi:RNA-directed DNA polymerase
MFYPYKQHPLKTFIGKLKKGFDWLGYQINETGICGAAPRTLEKYAAKLRRLYEQTRQLGLDKTQTEQRVTDYRKRWQQYPLAAHGTALRTSHPLQAQINPPSKKGGFTW